MSLYVINKVVIPGAIISDVSSTGICQLSSAYNMPSTVNSRDNDRIVSIRTLIYQETFTNSYSDEHNLVHLWTKSYSNTSNATNMTHEMGESIKPRSQHLAINIYSPL